MTTMEVNHESSLLKKFARKMEVENESNSDHSSFLTNKDLLPVPYEKRTWTAWTYALFWFGECASVTSWTVASTGVKSGLSWWESWICVIIGHFIVAWPMVYGGRPGAVYHVPFPIITRASFGVWGSYWPIFNRNAMTVIWTGVQGVTTGNCIYVMLHAIFPSIAKVHDPFSKDVTMTGGRLIAYSVGWVLCLGCAFIKPQRLSFLIYFKSAIMMICLITFFGWSLGKANGIGPIIHAGAAIPKGKSHAWLFIQNLFVQAANMATFATNNADTARYARRPKDMMWTQLVFMPLAYGLVAFFGVFVTSASRVIFGTVMWDPNAILDGFLTANYNAHTRAGVFFIALGFSFAQVTTVLFANLIAAGNDTAAMFPKWVNYRRGAIIVLVLSFAITPWNLTKTSFTFTSYLTSYQIFLSSIIGVILADYYLVRKGKFEVDALFSNERNTVYHYYRGWNWRAYAAYVIGIIPVLPGFLSSVGVKGISVGYQRFYYFALPVGIVLGMVSYWAINLWMPPPGGLIKEWSEPKVDIVDGISGSEDNVVKAEAEVSEKAWV